MRKLILFFLFVFSVTVGFAQSFSGDKLFISVDGGKGVLFGKSNLSPFGVNYRGEYNGGLTCNVNTLDDETNVADNVELWYLGPQLGFKIPITERTLISCVLGAGYLHYRDEGRSNSEFKCTSGALAGNMDFLVEYKLTDHLAVNGGFSVLSGDFKKIEMTADEKKETLRPNKLDRLYMRRLDFQLGLVFCY